MRTCTLLFFVPGSHTSFELSHFLEFSEFVRIVFAFSSSKGSGNNHMSRYLTQLHTVGKMVEITVKHGFPDTVEFSSTSFADTD